MLKLALMDITRKSWPSSRSWVSSLSFGPSQTDGIRHRACLSGVVFKSPDQVLSGLLNGFNLGLKAPSHAVMK